MGKRAIFKRHVDPDIFKSYIKSHGTSVRQLGTLCETNERSIRRMIQDQEVTLNIALDLCAYFHCDFDELFGPDDSYQWQQAVELLNNTVR